jgi:hypothetical protein
VILRRTGFAERVVGYDVFCRKLRSSPDPGLRNWTQQAVCDISHIPLSFACADARAQIPGAPQWTF